MTLALYNAPAGSPGNRIYIVEGLAVHIADHPDERRRSVLSAGNAGRGLFQNYSFLGTASIRPTVATSTRSTSLYRRVVTAHPDDVHPQRADWNGAASERLTGSMTLTRSESQLNAAGKPYGDLVWSGATPWDPNRRPR